MARGQRTAGEPGRPYRISQPATSKHIRTLERLGLVIRSIEGREHRIRLALQRLREAETAWRTTAGSGSDSLSRFLKKE